MSQPPEISVTALLVELSRIALMPITYSVVGNTRKMRNATSARPRNELSSLGRRSCAPVKSWRVAIVKGCFTTNRTSRASR